MKAKISETLAENTMKKTVVTTKGTKANGSTLSKSVTGYAWSWKGLDFVIHRNVFKACSIPAPWVITEPITGRSITSLPHKTRKRAISEAEARLEEVGRARFIKLIAANLST